MLVDGTADINANRPSQREAASRMSLSAAQARVPVIDCFGKCNRHPATWLRIKLATEKCHAIRDTAGPTTGTSPAIGSHIAHLQYRSAIHRHPPLLHDGRENTSVSPQYFYRPPCV